LFLSVSECKLIKKFSKIFTQNSIRLQVDDHPHVIQLKAIYEKKGRMYLVMELVTGGELFDRIIARQHFSETDARDLMYVLISTVKHMHTHGIVHRDLKPENILFANPAPDAAIKIGTHFCSTKKKSSLTLQAKKSIHHIVYFGSCQGNVRILVFLCSCLASSLFPCKLVLNFFFVANANFVFFLPSS
jgi:serine/threonine protein kinase